MKKYSNFRVVSTAEAALKKLQKSKIAVFGCKKSGADFIFGVKDKDSKKVFAIFNKPCYNIRREHGGAASRAVYTLILRIGLVVGGLVILLASYFSCFFMLRVEVCGSGSYLAGVVKDIVAEEGGREFCPYSSFDAPAAAGRIMSLPQVIFCNIQKNGSVLVVDVEVSPAPRPHAVFKDLVSDEDGQIVYIAAICGTACLSAGDMVKRGDVVISAQTLIGEEYVPSLAVGYARIRCTKTYEYFIPDNTPQSVQTAYASLLLEDLEIIEKSHVLRPADGGFVAVMEISYLHKISINLT